MTMSNTENNSEKMSRRGREGSLLENVKPPAEMEELLELENSILSVASLTSEIADDATLEAFTPPSQRRLTPKQRREVGKNR